MISKFVKQILLWVNYFMIAALLLSYMAAYVPPYKIPFLAVLGLGFPYLFMFNVLFVLFWAFLKKYYFILSLVVLLLGVGRIDKYFNIWTPQKQIVKEKLGQEFSVMSYNVRVFDLYNWSNNKQTRNNIFSFLRQKGPDIVCFQEYFNQKGAYFPVHDSLMNNQRFTNYHIYYYKELVYNQHQFGIATYSVYPIVNKQVIVFDDSYNCAIYSDIKVGADTVRVFNVHLQSFRLKPVDYQFIDSISTLSEEQRVKGAMGVYERMRIANGKRAAQAEIIVEKIDASPYPVVLCGDFNEPPSSYSYQVLTTNLNDSHLQKNWGLGGTFPRFIPSFRIDYLLYQNSVYCTDYAVFKNNFSDHYPIMGHYSIIKKEPVQQTSQQN